MKSILICCLLAIVLLPCMLLGQYTHTGDQSERLKTGRHVWSDPSGQIRAEVVYDKDGVIVSFRTWDERGLLIDEIKLDPKRKRTELPPIALTFDEDGFGYQLIGGKSDPGSAAPRQGERVGVYYEGYLQDGTVFDGNFGAKKPFRFKFQMGDVVAGFDRAVSMLKVGEEGYFWIPSTLAYGANVAGEIPPFSDLLFRIRLVELN